MTTMPRLGSQTGGRQRSETAASDATTTTKRVALKRMMSEAEEMAINFGGEDSTYYDTSAAYGEKHAELRNIVRERPFELLADVNLMCKVIVETTIVFNCIQLGVCAHPAKSDALDKFCNQTDAVFTLVFTGEFLYKLCKLRASYWKSNWNRFDFFLLAVTYMDLVLAFFQTNVTQAVGGLDLRDILIFKLLRLLRILRVLRVLQHKMEMKMVLEGLVASFASMYWVALMLGMFIYVMSIICVTFFSHIHTGHALDFSTIPKAMFALFTLAIVADWTDIVAPVTDKYWWATPFFVLFIICATFGIMNLIIGVITERTSHVQNMYRKRQELRLDGLRMNSITEIAEIMFRECESYGDEEEPTITKQTMEEFTKHEKYGPVIHHLVHNVSLPAGYEIHHCHPMFDRDVTGTITKDEFVQGMGRLIFSNEFQRSCIVQSSIADVLVEMKAIEGRLLARIGEMEANFFSKFAGTEMSQPPSGSAALVQNSQASEAVEVTGGDEDDNSSRVRQLLRESPKEPPKDLPACKALLERLHEPLAVLLAIDLNSRAATLSTVDDCRELIGAEKASRNPGDQCVRNQQASQLAARAASGSPSRVGVPRVPLRPTEGVPCDHVPSASARSQTSNCSPSSSEQVQDLIKQVKERWECTTGP